MDECALGRKPLDGTPRKATELRYRPVAVVLQVSKHGLYVVQFGVNGHSTLRSEAKTKCASSERAFHMQERDRALVRAFPEDRDIMMTYSGSIGLSCSVSVLLVAHPGPSWMVT